MTIIWRGSIRKKGLGDARKSERHRGKESKGEVKGRKVGKRR